MNDLAELTGSCSVLSGWGPMSRSHIKLLPWGVGDWPKWQLARYGRATSGIEINGFSKYDSKGRGGALRIWFLRSDRASSLDWAAKQWGSGTGY